MINILFKEKTQPDTGINDDHKSRLTSRIASSAETPAIWR